jgi:hypothetical protein
MAGDELRAFAVSDLRQALGRVLDAVKQRFGASIDLEADHYWSLDAVDSFDLRTDPSVMAGARLTEAGRFRVGDRRLRQCSGLFPGDRALKWRACRCP